MNTYTMTHIPTEDVSFSFFKLIHCLLSKQKDDKRALLYMMILYRNFSKAHQGFFPSASELSLFQLS